MARRSAVSLGAVSLLVVLSACAENPLAPRPGTIARVPDGQLALRAVATGGGAAGSTLTVVVKLETGARTSSVGSYAVRLAYDTTALRFIGAAPVMATAGSMAAANLSRPGEVAVAGAAVSGFVTGALAEVTFEVRDARAARGLALEVLELTNVAAATLTDRVATDGAADAIPVRVARKGW